MIKHIVCFKLKDNGDAEKQKVKELLLSMRSNVPTVKDIEVGCDFLGSPRSYDIILQVTLDDKSVLDEYQNDSYHVNVVKKYMHEASESSVAVDYELN